MPPNTVATSQGSSTYRRPTVSSKHRENRPHTPVSGPSRRRKSRSPDVRVAGDTVVEWAGEAGALRRKKKSSSALSNHSSNVRSLRDVVTSDDIGKAKHKHRPHSQISEDPDMQTTSDPRQSNKNKRRERSRSREPSRRPTPKTPISDASGDEEDMDMTTHNHTDVARMKKELEELRKQLHYVEKRGRKQDKEVEKLRKELLTSQKATSEQSLQITKIKSQSKKADELIGTIENHMNCHICMEILARPYGLSPCGHVLCMGCLQEWFRTAAPNEDDMDEDDTPDALVYRRKICPVCRTVVRARPIPLFVVKSIASALEKHKAGPSGNTVARASPPLEADPWDGIFLDPSMEEVDDDDGDEDEDDYDEQWSSDGDGFGDGYASGYEDSEDDEDYQGGWVQPTWEPPNGQVSPQDYAYLDEVEGEELSMIRRGCTLQMISLFRMRYDHRLGLQALVDDSNTVHLGWNVHLLDHDNSGEEFMDWITRDIHERPERWLRVDNTDGSWSAWRLARENAEQDYETTDSEMWFDGQMNDDELDLL